MKSVALLFCVWAITGVGIAALLDVTLGPAWWHWFLAALYYAASIATNVMVWRWR